MDFEFSMVASVKSTETTPCRFRETLAKIVGGAYESEIHAVRAAYAAGGKEAADGLKKRLPAFLPSGTFSHRSAKGLVKHSGLICVDLDGLGDALEGMRDLVVGDEHVLAAFISPTGTGLKVILRCDPLRPHAESFEAAKLLFLERFGLEIDEACKDVSRLCFVSHDPDLFSAEDATCLPYPAAPVEFAPTGQTTYPAGELTPGDDYDQHVDFPAFLMEHGWKPAGRSGKYWTRPGKERGVSASWNVVPGRLYVFSDAAGLEPNHVYRPWHVFAVLECGGDFSRAAAELRRQGFGSSRPSKAPAVSDPAGIEPPPDQRDAKAVKSQVDAAALLARAWAAEIDPTSPPPADRPVFYINNHLAGTSSNIMAVSGRAKTAKTTVLGAMQAACIVADGGGGEDVDTLGIRSAPPAGRAVIVIDTEQSPAHAAEQLRRTLMRAGLPPESKPDWLHVFPLAGWSARELSAVLPAILNDGLVRHDGIHAVFIDGGADFANDVNSPEEAATLCTAWHALAIQYQCVIVVIIHSNESRQADDIARGWLGKQLRRKAESNLTLKRDGDVIILYGEDGQRHAPILEKDGPRFAWDNASGMHRSIETLGSVREGAQVAELRELAEEVFAGDRMRYADVIDKIEKARRIAHKTAEKRFSAMRKHKIIRKEGLGLWGLAVTVEQEAA